MAITAPVVAHRAQYKSHKQVESWALDKIQVFWQDNGLYGRNDGDNPGLYNTDYRAIGESVFAFGAPP